MQLLDRSSPLQRWLALQCACVVAMICNGLISDLHLWWFAVPLLFAGVGIISLAYPFAANRNGLTGQFTHDMAAWTVSRGGRGYADQQQLLTWRTISVFQLLYGLIAIVLAILYLLKL